MDAPDLVAGLHSDPLGDRPVLFLLLGEEALDPERLVGRLRATQTPLSTRIYIIYNVFYLSRQKH